MFFFQQCQVKVHDQKPLSCTKTNKTYLSKHPSTYFFIGSQMEGFRGTSTYVNEENRTEQNRTEQKYIKRAAHQSQPPHKHPAKPGASSSGRFFF